MDILKEGANLFSYASQDPLIDYIKEGAKLFQHMESNLKRQFLTAIFTLLEQRGEINWVFNKHFLSEVGFFYIIQACFPKKKCLK